ncbi:D-aminopeptidase [uncultured Woeseiaceae bacterium]|uniref:D-aminopeptidase n=1 Tax=uncultured Woeseiaceae bacterium TaxID=1983305 RepID=A0A7D9D2I1_9GAMM|nr:D-aminopeptidase [uncultured Woeseiaceae bacterium]
MKIRNRLCLVVLAVFSSTALAQDGLKIYISADMEGVVGAVTDAQLGPDGFEYERFRQFMTNEVNAAIDAARAAGANEFVISDSHGNGQNLLIDQLPVDVTIVRSWPREHSMMAGIDETFDGVIFLGYHASTNNTRGVRAHTMSSANITSLRLNGMTMTEGSMNAAIAGHFGVPVIMVSGDDIAVAENQVIIGDIEGAVVKWASGFHSARTLTPEAAYEVIRTRTKSAIDRIDDFEPYVLATPIELELSLKHYQPVELLAYLSNVEKVNSHTIRFIGDDITEVSNFLTVVTSYRIDLQP